MQQQSQLQQIRDEIAIWPERRRRHVRAAGLAALIVFVIAGVVGRFALRDDGNVGNRPVIFVLDSFYNNFTQGHGSDVVTICEHASFGLCEIRTITLKSDGAASALQDVLDYMDETPGARVVVNMSFGGYVPREDEHDLIQKLAQRGAVLVAAAGNENTEDKVYPAGYDEVIAVGAVDGGRKTEYSNYGDHIDIVASGRDRHGYESRTGTSLAAPRVSGFIGYLLARNPELTPAEAWQVVQESSSTVRDERFAQRQLGAGKLGGVWVRLKWDYYYRRVLLAKLTAVGVVFIAMLLAYRKAEKHSTGSGCALLVIAGFALLTGIVFDQVFTAEKRTLVNRHIVSAYLVLAVGLYIAFLYYRTMKTEEVEHRIAALQEEESAIVAEQERARELASRPSGTV